MSAFFYSPGIMALDCPAGLYDETVSVKSIHDGDTLKLSDGRKIRLIGINTPELARNDQPAQPYAEQARQQLHQLISHANHQVHLVYGIDRKDKYRRTLAHLYLPNGQNIQAELIRQGLATAFTTPPNDRQSSCYRQQEQLAIQQKRGIWSLPEYRIIKSNDITKNARGFQRIQGQVIKTHKSDKSFWINLQGDLKIRIRHSDLKYFDLHMLQRLEGKTVVIRGWLHPEKRGHFMNLRHPDAFSLIPQPDH